MASKNRKAPRMKAASAPRASVSFPPELYRTLEARYGFRPPRQAHQCLAQVVVAPHIVRLDDERGLVTSDSRGESARCQQRVSESSVYTRVRGPEPR